MFRIENEQVNDEIPVLKEKPSELLNIHMNKLTVNYIGKSNPSIPAVKLK